MSAHGDIDQDLHLAPWTGPDEGKSGIEVLEVVEVPDLDAPGVRVGRVRGRRVAPPCLDKYGGRREADDGHRGEYSPPMRESLRRRVKALLFRIVRPLFVKDVDRNEDYECVECGEPVLRRDLVCSEECGRKSGL